MYGGVLPAHYRVHDAWAVTVGIGETQLIRPNRRLTPFSRFTFARRTAPLRINLPATNDAIMKPCQSDDWEPCILHGWITRELSGLQVLVKSRASLIQLSQRRAHS